MNSTQHKHTSLTLKFSALAGVAVSASATAQAAVVPSLTVGSGITPPASVGSFYWDVDGDSIADFRLLHGSLSEVSINEANFDDANGGRLVGERIVTAYGSSVRGDAIKKLTAGFIVGANMPGFDFGTSPQTSVTMTSSGNIGNDAAAQGWSFGDTGYFGFKFTSGPDTFYGWGVLSITGSPIGQGFIITEAYYENTPGLSIEVGSLTSIPEPASAAALLGLGAAGIAAWRRRRPAAV
jgi:hypothetical protein